MDSRLYVHQFCVLHCVRLLCVWPKYVLSSDTVCSAYVHVSIPTTSSQCLLHQKQV